MLKTEQPVSRRTSTTKRAERAAWALLLVSFGLFCALSYLGVSYGRYWLARSHSGVISAAATQQGVTLKRNGLATNEVLQTDELNPGDTVRVSLEATPGVASTLRFGSATLGLWPGTELQVGTFGPQWNDSTAATARFTINAGQVLIDIADDDQRIAIQSSLAPTPAIVQGSGRYLIRILEAGNPTTARVDQPVEPTLEVATERGIARFGTTEIRQGQRLTYTQAQGQLSQPRIWNLLRDGSFQEVVNASFGDSNARQLWNEQREATAQDAVKSGQVQWKQDCLDPIARTDCAEPYVRLVRRGGNEKGFTTAIAQNVDADVGAYKSVWLRADLKVVYQSLSMAGESGTECPLLMRVTYTSNQAQNLIRDYCYWAMEKPGEGAISSLSYITTKQLPRDQWVSVELDLKQEIPELLKVQQISFQANGHDYESQVKAAQLFAEGLDSVPAP